VPGANAVTRSTKTTRKKPAAKAENKARKKKARARTASTSSSKAAPKKKARPARKVARSAASKAAPRTATAKPAGKAARKTAPASARADARQTSEPAPDRPIRKTHLRPDELEYFRDVLTAKRNELLGAVDHLANSSMRNNRQDAAGDLSAVPIHMADIGSDNWEQEFTLDLLSAERDLVREIDAALERIDKGTYGICLGTNKPINKSRLKAKPWAKYCIEYARDLELRGGR
jgi:DnaK suppressor protein